MTRLVLCCSAIAAVLGLCAAEAPAQNANPARPALRVGTPSPNEIALDGVLSEARWTSVNAVLKWSGKAPRVG